MQDESPVVICAVHYCQVSAFCCSARNEFSYWIRKQPKKPSYSAQLNLVWHRMLYSCTDMATVGVTGLNAAPKTHCLLGTMKCCVVMLCSYRVRRVPMPRNGSCTGPMLLCSDDRWTFRSRACCCVKPTSLYIIAARSAFAASFCLRKWSFSASRVRTALDTTLTSTRPASRCVLCY